MLAVYVPVLPMPCSVEWHTSCCREICSLLHVCVGHAGDVIGDIWYIVGGGNNTSGCTDMVALDLIPLTSSGSAEPTEEPLTWSEVSQAEARSAIVSEGLTVDAIPYARCLLSFGGYNGKYQSALQIYKPGKCIT